MASQTSSVQLGQRVAYNRLLWVGPLTILAAVVAVFIIQQVAVALLVPDPLFIPLTLAVPIVFTVIAVLGAIIVYALIGRFAKQPISLFRRVALITLGLLFIPDIILLITGFNPGTTAANVVALMVMHVVVGAITVGMLTNLAGAEA